MPISTRNDIIINNSNTFHSPPVQVRPARVDFCVFNNFYEIIPMRAFASFDIIFYLCEKIDCYENIGY